MSVQSDAAKKHIEKLLNEAMPEMMEMESSFVFSGRWLSEYSFDKLNSGRKWRFDYCVPSLRVAIELDGGTFQAKRTGHASGTGLRAWREKNNAAMSAGWRVWHYAPEEIIKAGRKTLPDEPILKVLPWLEKRIEQKSIVPSANLSGVSIFERYTITPLLIPGSAREGSIIKSGHIGNMSWMSVSTGTTGCKQRKLEAEV